MKGQPMPRVRLGGQIKGSTDKPIVTGLSTKDNTLLNIDVIPDQSLLMRSGTSIVGTSAASLPSEDSGDFAGMEAGETLTIQADTININIAGLTAKAAPSPEDMFPVWDPAAAGYRRVTVGSLPTGGASAAATVAELRNLPVSEGAIAILSGRANGADGAGGVFCWDSGAIDADNGATIIGKASGGIGRWKRLQTGAVNVRWFGAKGDGTTDDTAAFAAALSAGSVWVPNGTYRITSPLQLTGARTISFESRNAILKYRGAGYCIDADGWRDGLLKNGTIDWSLASGSECGAVHLRCHLGSCAYNVVRDMTFIGGMTLADRAPGRYSIRLTGNVEQVAQTAPAFGFATYYNLVSHCRFYGADTHVRLVNGNGANPWTQQPNAFRSIANTYEAYIWGIWIDDSDEHLSIGDWFTGAFAIAGYGGTGSETDDRTYAYRLNGIYNQFVNSTVEAGDGAAPGKFASTDACELNRIDIISNCMLGWDNTIGNTKPNTVLLNGIRMPYGALTIAGATPDVSGLAIAATGNDAPTTITGFVGLQPTQSLILHVADGYTSVATSALMRVDNQPEGRTVPLAAGDVWMVSMSGGVVMMARLFAFGGRESYGTMRLTAPAATVLANATDWVKIAGTTEAPAADNKEWVQVANNQIAWLPVRSARIEVTAHLTLSGNTAGTTYDLCIARNAPNPPTAAELAYGIQARITATTDRVAVSLTARYASLTRYDNLGVYVKAAQASQLTAEKLVLVIREVL
jgi:hypothetical protein